MFSEMRGVCGEVEGQSLALCHLNGLIALTSPSEKSAVEYLAGLSPFVAMRHGEKRVVVCE